PSSPMAAILTQEWGGHRRSGSEIIPHHSRQGIPPMQTLESPSLAPSVDHARLTIDIRSEDSTTVVAFAGQSRGPLPAADRDRILAAAQPGCRLMLDFSALEEISGSGMRYLLLLARYVRGLGGTVAARGASDHLVSIGEVSGFMDIFGRTAQMPVPSTRYVPRVRTDYYPTRSYGGFGLRPGIPQPLGAPARPHGVNFAVYPRHATECSLVLFEPGAATPFAEIPFPPEFRVGNVHAMAVFNVDPEEFEYGFRMDG